MALSPSEVQTSTMIPMPQGRNGNQVAIIPSHSALGTDRRREERGNGRWEGGGGSGEGISG